MSQGEPSTDDTPIQEYLGVAAGALGGTALVAGMMLGDRVGYYRALAEGQANAEELATTPHPCSWHVVLRAWDRSSSISIASNRPTDPTGPWHGENTTSASSPERNGSSGRGYRAQNMTDNPIAPMMYSACSMLCVPNSLVQPGGRALGAGAGPDALRAVFEGAGFRELTMKAETPFNQIYQATI